MRLGFLGLGKMGQRMAAKLVEDKHEVIVWNRSTQVSLDFVNKLKQDNKSASVDYVLQISEFSQKLGKQQVFWLMLPAEATEQVISDLKPILKRNDILIDGGNAYFKDTQRRFELFKREGIYYLGAGVSGGIVAEKLGYPIMVGGDKKAYLQIEPILKSLSLPSGGFAYLGTGGAGHFVKMVHNGIEYGMMQALAEGFGVLEKAPYKLNLTDVAKIWQRGTIISGFLLDRAKDALEKNPSLLSIAGIIGSASKESVWTIEEAKKEKVPIENIEQSLNFRLRSKNDTSIQQSFAAKMVSAIRHEFGGHDITKKT